MRSNNPVVAEVIVDSFMFKKRIVLFVGLIGFFSIISVSEATGQQVRKEQSSIAYQDHISTLIKQYCTDCHNSESLEGKLSLETISPKVGGGKDFEVWRMIYERVKYGDMPPKDSDQLTQKERSSILTWIRSELLKTQQPGYSSDPKMKLPEYGNYVDHDALFNQPAGPVIPASPRIWRLRPSIYNKLDIGDSRLKKSHNLSVPLTLSDGTQFKDYAVQYFIDEPTTDMLLGNAEKIVRVRSRFAIDLLSKASKPPTEEDIKFAINKTFKQILQREASLKEVERFSLFFQAVSKTSGRELAAERLMIAIYMQPEALFREELGAGQPDKLSRIRLSQMEIAQAIMYALGDHRDTTMINAAIQGKLGTKQEILKQINERFDHSGKSLGNTRILQFFREYFNYTYATEIFKDKPSHGYHLPHLLIQDLELTIKHIVNKDENVLYHLLTTNEFHVDSRFHAPSSKLYQASLNPGGSGVNAVRSDPEYATLYGLPRDWIWTDQQPITLPKKMRAGVLTHPAWLVAWSGNFDNHPVQRGKWIRTHLLGGTIPDVPIGVDAMVPEDKHKQFRERLEVATSDSECSRCHKKMEPLGLVFEQYDHYGRFRTKEVSRPIDTSGTITFVEESSLIGEVKNPIEMMHKLAKSQHVEQVFVRHVFRFYLGRNETLGDAKTLQDAHQAYRKSNGSFRALVTSLLLSDSFLLRSVQSDETISNNETNQEAVIFAQNKPAAEESVSVKKPKPRKDILKHKILSKKESHEAIEKAIRERIKKPEGDLTEKDLERVTFLNLEAKGLSDISPLSKLKELTNLQLNYNEVRDLSPLAQLTELENLHVGSNFISDISPLKKLEKLRRVSLYRNMVSDLSPIKGWKNIEYLSLYVNPVSEISAIHGLKTLTKVKLQGNPVPNKAWEAAKKALPDCDVMWQPTNHVYDQHCPIYKGEIDRHLKLPENQIKRGNGLYQEYQQKD